MGVLGLMGPWAPGPVGVGRLGRDLSRTVNRRWRLGHRERPRLLGLAEPLREPLRALGDCEGRGPVCPEPGLS